MNNIHIPHPKNREKLNIAELSEEFGWTPRFIDSLVRTQKLPTLQEDGKIWFERSALISWLNQKIQTLEEHDVYQFEKKLESTLVSTGTFTRKQAHDRISTRLSTECIALDIPLNTADDILVTLTQLATQTGLVYESGSLLQSLIERESVSSTALPEGVALCHPNGPKRDLIATQFFCLLRTREPVDFHSSNGSKTSLFFLICATDDTSHLYSLARLSRLIHAGAASYLKSAKNPQEIIQVLERYEALVDSITH